MCHPSILVLSPPPLSHDFVLCADCAVCTKGYGRGLSHTCHYCGDTSAHFLIGFSALLSLLAIMLMLVAVVYLVRGHDAINPLRQHVIRSISRMRKEIRKCCVVAETDFKEQNDSEDGVSIHARGSSIAHVHDLSSGVTNDVGEGGNNQCRGLPSTPPEPDEPDPSCARSPCLVRGVSDGFGQPNMAGKHPLPDKATTTSGNTRKCSFAGADVTEANVDTKVKAEPGGGGKSKVGGLVQTIIRSSRRSPMDKLKILLGMWQIIALFSSITGVEFPTSYSLFLSWINILNVDLGYIISASCVLPSVNFYGQLIAITIAPFVVAAGLVWTYHLAKRRTAIGSASEFDTFAAWSRHVKAGLLLTFVVSVLW